MGWLKVYESELVEIMHINILFLSGCKITSVHQYIHLFIDVCIKKIEYTSIGFFSQTVDRV
jgi:hypothetical protein